MPRWMPPDQRFWTKVRRHEGGCWEWEGCRSDTGYGTFYAGRVYSSHRYSWELHNGPIPKGMCVLHRCDNRACVRPDHLWLGTKADNSRDMAAKGRERAPSKPGSQHHGAKLTEAAVLEIRASADSGRVLAERYGVSPSLISLVRKRRAWQHV